MKKMNIILFMLFAIFLVGVPFLADALTPAGTNIVNQSSITYRDSSGDIITTNTNEVLTVVLPVYDFIIIPDGTVANPGQSQNSTAGGVVYYQYTLINTGNQTDSYNLSSFVDPTSDFTPIDIQIYLDTNANGVIDPGENVLSGNVLSNVDPNNPISLIMRYQVPVTAQEGEVTYVDIRGISIGDPSKTDEQNFNKTILVDDAVIVATKSASVNNAAAGDTIIYTINGSNTGNQPTEPDSILVDGSWYYGLIIADPLPTHNDVPFQVTEGSAGGNPTGGTVIYMVGGDPSVNTPIDQWNGVWQVAYSADATAIAYVTGNTQPGTGVIAPSQSFNFVFSVRIPIDYPASNVDNTGIAGNVKTNTVTTVVGGSGFESVAIMVGPYHKPTDHDLQINTEDTTFVDTASAGETIDIPLTVYNAGNSTDIINIDLLGMNLGNRGNWLVAFYKLDGVSPLSDTNSDGFPDVGALSSGDSASFIVKVTIPSDQLAIDGTTIEVQAISTREPISDLPDIITSVVGYSPGTNMDNVTLDNMNGFVDEVEVGDFLNINHEVRRVSLISGNTVTVPKLDNDPLGYPTSAIISGRNKTTVFFKKVFGAGLDYKNRYPAHPDSVTKTGQGGSYVDFPLTIVNPALLRDTYTLTEILPPGWSVQYYRDANNDSIPDNLNPITSLSVAGQDSGFIIARIFVPNGVTVDTYPIDYIATSTRNPNITDSFTDYVVIPPAPAVLLDPDRTGTGIPGYTVEYIHDLINLGNTILPGENTVGPTSYFTVSSSNGWSYVLYQQDPNDPTIFTQLTVNPDSTFNLAYEVGIDGTSVIKVKIFIPAGTPDGTMETGVITFFGQGVATGASDDATDITTIINGNLYKEKRVVNITTESDTTWQNATNYNQGLPGDMLKYYIYYKNIGNGSIDLVTIYDFVPTYTTYVGGTATFEIGTGTIEFSTDGGATWQPTEPADPTTVTNIKWNHSDGANFVSGEEGRVSFKVVIQ